jgi:hypothetical protein
MDQELLKYMLLQHLYNGEDSEDPDYEYSEYDEYPEESESEPEEDFDDYVETESEPEDIETEYVDPELFREVYSQYSRSFDESDTDDEETYPLMFYQYSNSTPNRKSTKSTKSKKSTKSTNLGLKKINKYIKVLEKLKI